MRTRLALAGVFVAALCAAAAPVRTQGQAAKPVLYVIATSHLDSQWNWTVQDSIRRFVPTTFHENLLSRTSAYAYLNKVIVGEVTSTIRGIPEEVSVGRREGVAQSFVVNLDNVHVIARARLGDRLGTLTPDRERDVKRALGYALGWPELKVL